MLIITLLSEYLKIYSRVLARKRCLIVKPQICGSMGYQDRYEPSGLIITEVGTICMLGAKSDRF